VSRLLVLRHAQSVWNAAGRWQGWSDAPLSELGASQARHAGEVLAAMGVKPAMMACSDLDRARGTAAMIAAAVGYDQHLVVDRDLREQNLGEWNGLTSVQIEARWPQAIQRRDAGSLDDVPGGERGLDFQRRCSGALARLAGAIDEAAEAIVVAHGGVVMALEKRLGIWEPGRRHQNVSGWWVQSAGQGLDLEVFPLSHVDLLAMNVETVTRPA
jgi:broad specificity phosphatase PhoE